MTPLADILKRRIATQGPISVAEYMAECLLHPDHGYYATRDPFGTAGDFITAPEISQMFGEMIGLFLAQVWIDQGRPSRFLLAEPGPGRGTLMADVLRVARSVPGFTQAAQVCLIEASPTLRGIQRQRLAETRVDWFGTLADLPRDAPLYLVANEFFDALPIRQFHRAGTAWREVQVTLAKDALTFGLTAPTGFAALEHRLTDTRDGDVVELCPAAGPAMAEIAGRIAANGGVGLIFDYGNWNGTGDTLQALKSHRPVDPLDEPGLADLTAHVDFAALARAAQPAKTTPMTGQGVFLERLGITQRAQALAKNLSGDALSSHIAAHRRLTHPQEMGSLFKVMGICPPGARDLPGFDQ